MLWRVFIFLLGVGANVCAQDAEVRVITGNLHIRAQGDIDVSSEDPVVISGNLTIDFSDPEAVIILPKIVEVKSQLLVIGNTASLQALGSL
jgi:hypothetical protein